MVKEITAMGNDYYLKHKSDKTVTLGKRDRILIQTLLVMEIQFAENKLDKSIEPAFSIEHMKALYEKISGRNFNESYEKR